MVNVNTITFHTKFLGPVVYILEKCDKIANMVCPFLAGSVIVGSLWWTAVTYGAITVMQVFCTCSCFI